MEHLTEAFVKVRTTDYGGKVVDWIHPSYRDLVIDELIQSADLRNTFLRRASLEGVKLAVSDTGGQYGKRRLPFIRSAESWDVLGERCLSLVAADVGDRDVLEVLGNAASQNSSPEHKTRWARLLVSVCNAVRAKWDTESRLMGAADLEAFAKQAAAKGYPYRRENPLHRLYYHEIAPPEKIAYKMRKLGEWLESEEFRDLHPITRATKAHYKLLSTYPWTKNSGKVARLLMNFMLLRHGYLPAVIHSIERQRYYEVLRFENDGLLNLVVEIKGYRGEDAVVKKTTMGTYWVPGVNHLRTYGRWAFVELRNIHTIQSDFSATISREFDNMITAVVPAIPAGSCVWDRMRSLVCFLPSCTARTGTTCNEHNS